MLFLIENMNFAFERGMLLWLLSNVVRSDNVLGNFVDGRDDPFICQGLRVFLLERGAAELSRDMLHGGI